jgi:hypothetical protein
LFAVAFHFVVSAAVFNFSFSPLVARQIQKCEWQRIENRNQLSDSHEQFRAAGVNDFSPIHF